MSIDTSALNNFIGAASFANGPGGSKRAGGGSSSGGASWFEALSRAWGNTLDGQAAKITQMSDAIGTGSDQPSEMVQLTAASLRMQFISNNAATSQNSIGEALSAVARKQ